MRPREKPRPRMPAASIVDDYVLRSACARTLYRDAVEYGEKRPDAVVPLHLFFSGKTLAVYWYLAKEGLYRHTLEEMLQDRCRFRLSVSYMRSLLSYWRRTTGRHLKAGGWEIRVKAGKIGVVPCDGRMLAEEDAALYSGDVS